MNWTTKFRLYTFGRAALEGCLTTYANLREPPQPLIRAALAHAGVPEVHVLSDVRPFTDPGRGCRLGHIGVHPESMVAMRKHHFFEPWLWRLRQETDQALTGDPPEVIIVFYCRKGKHRSVAAAFYVSHILSQGGHTVKVKHLGSWGGTCRGKSENCANLENGERISALDTALRIWRA